MKNTTIRLFRLAALAALALAVSGCTAKKYRESSDNLKQLSVAVIAYNEENKAWPDSLAQLKPLIGKQGPLGVIGNGKDFATLTKNPLTGDDPGYEYAKPANPAASSTAILLYQLNRGKRDSSLPVAFADGSVRPASAP